MKRIAALFMPFLLLGGPPEPPAKEPSPERISMSVRDADWKDVLRAAMEHTDLNLSFDPDLDTRVQGLDLKGVTLAELLDEILPAYDLAYVRKGRSLHITKSDAGLHFYQVDNLSMRRTGSKEFSVNASGQIIQSTGGSGGGGTGGNTSAYVSSLQTSNSSDPWQELQVGLGSLIFGEGAPVAPAATQASAKTAGGPVSVSINKGGKTLLINPSSGVVTVGADSATQHRVERYLAEMQRRNRRQVLLEAKIVEVTLGTDSQMGVNWNTLLSNGAASGGIGTNVTGTFTPGSVLNANVQSPPNGVLNLVVQNSRVTAALSALASEGKLTVLSSPRLTALNNQKAILRVVQEQAYFLSSSQTTGAGSSSGVLSTTYNVTPIVVPIGIVLDIQPQISDDGGITLAVNPSVSDVASVTQFNLGTSAATGGASASLPVVNRRDLDTVAHLWSGETLVLAGIIKTTEDNTDRGVPWLRNVPFLGALFSQREKSKSQTELAIFITATLMEDGIQIEEQHKHSLDRLRKAGADTDPEPQAKPSRKLP